jgi:hypothetical protein
VSTHTRPRPMIIESRTIRNSNRLMRALLERHHTLGTGA